MSNFNIEFLKRAVELARENIDTGKGGPFGAVIVKDGKIIAEGSNHVTSDNDPTAHAEVVAIRKACHELNSFQLDGCEIYCSCEPCPMCLGAIYWARPEAVYFASGKDDASSAGFDDSFIYEEILLPHQNRKIPTSFHKLPEAIVVFKLWTEKEDKTEY
jgi:guanine deaminase